MPVAQPAAAFPALVGRVLLLPPLAAERAGGRRSRIVVNQADRLAAGRAATPVARVPR
ncbi:MAG: hypothetical protein WKG07_48620 [Hymenobacter sp.]